MEIDPHTLHQIVLKIQQQVRCPQCGEKVPVQVGSVRMTGDDFLLLQMKCATCDAYIVLHASLQTVEKTSSQKKDETQASMNNASSHFCTHHGDLSTLQRSVEEAGGSFVKLFGPL